MILLLLRTYVLFGKSFMPVNVVHSGPMKINLCARIYFSLLYMCPIDLIKTSEDLGVLRNSGLNISWIVAMILFYNTVTNIQELFTSLTCKNLIRLILSIIMELGFGLLICLDLIYISLILVAVLLSIVITLIIILVGLCLWSTFCGLYNFISNTSDTITTTETSPILPVKLPNNVSSIKDWVDPRDKNMNRYELLYPVIAAVGALNIFSLFINPIYVIFIW